MLKGKISQAEQIRRLKEVTADEDKYFPGVLGNPVRFALRWDVPLSKRYRDSQGKKTAAPIKKSKPLQTAAKLFSISNTGKRIRVRLKAFDYRVINQSTREITDTAIRTGARIAGSIPVPTRVERFTVRRPLHSGNKSHEAIEQHTHRRLIDILDPTSKTVDELKKLNLPAGVDITIKI